MEGAVTAASAARLRTYAFGLVSAVVVATFAIGETLTENFVSAHSRAAGTAIELAIVAIGALALRPLHSRVEAFVEAAFTKRRREAREALAHVQKQLTSLAETRQVLRHVIDAVDRHMSTAGSAIYLWRGGYASEASSFEGPVELVPLNDALPIRLRSSPRPVDPRALGSLAAGSLAFPMMARGELVGFLTIAPKGIDYEPEDIHALGALTEATGLALVTLDSELRLHEEPRTNLPHLVKSFVGRAHDVAEVQALLREHRLVTLVGAGGIGKTRMALEIGTAMLDDIADGVWFVDLAPVSDETLVADTIARTLNLPQSATREPLPTILGFLKRKRLLLIVDNCEHMIHEVRSACGAIVRGCPDVRILATSREALAIAGEEAYRTPSLGADGAMQLFADRARSADKRFALTDDNATDVAEICRRLDGIPLAIELAAARVKILTPRQLAQKLHERFRVLTAGDRSALPRHQTMRALIDWSYDLLAEREQAIFREVSIFVNGFTTEQADGLCESSAIDALDVFDVLTSLVDKSLVLAEPWEETTRYRLLESTRDYASERLTQESEYEAVANRHASLFADFLEALDRQHDTLAPSAWFARAEAEIENLRAALSWSFSCGDRLVGQRIAVSLPRIFGAIAPAEGLRWVEAATDCVTEETPNAIAAGLELARASFASVFNHFNVAYKAAERTLALFEGVDAGRIADAQRLAGRSLVYMGRVAEGEALLRKALENRTASGSTRVGGILGDLAVARALQGDVTGARSLFAQASSAFEEAADTSKVMLTAATLAEAEFLAGNAEEALRLAKEALASARELRRYHLLAGILINIAAYELSLQRYSDAKMHAREALDICCEGPRDEVSLIYAMQHLASVSMLENTNGSRNAVRAANLLGYVDGRLEALEITREHTELSG
ncbi:MAG TPA: NB-ARC domain-containing protein, partial [Candidatus Baltobacteraceae bacterium]|nr:NB-ARC domain-containing protein [Candidatus Baltobacteraceae bacterium]